MAHKFVRECSIRFVEQEIPDLFWEFTVQKQSDGNSTEFALNLQIPVVGCGLVHQSFPLQQDDLDQLTKWITANMLQP